MMYRLTRGEITSGMHVCHHCDNPLCCNPAHLLLGTPAENMADKVAKGRPAKGDSHGRSRLSSADIPIIRARCAAGEPHRLVAADYGVSKQAISHIVRGKSWAHVA